MQIAQGPHWSVQIMTARPGLTHCSNEQKTNVGPTLGRYGAFHTYFRTIVMWCTLPWVVCRICWFFRPDQSIVIVCTSQPIFGTCEASKDGSHNLHHQRILRATSVSYSILFVLFVDNAQTMSRRGRRSICKQTLDSLTGAPMWMRRGRGCWSAQCMARLRLP